MAVEQITAAEFEDRLRSALLRRTKRYDTAYGPIKDVVIKPVADVLADQNNRRLRTLSLLLSLQNLTEFTDSDVDLIVYNEELIRPAGAQATTTITFTRTTPFGSSESGIIPRGYPIGTSIDEDTGQPVTFVTTESKDKTSAVAILDTDTNSTVYEVEVPAVALLKGAAGKVGPDRVNRPLRPLVGYDSVTNKEAAQEGRDRYSNAELVELFFLAVHSRQLSVPAGSEFHTRDTFSAVEDVNEVFGTSDLLERAATDAGAVDSFIVGENLLTKTDQITFLGVGQKMVLTTPPVIRIDSVVRVSDSHVYIEDEDYEVLLDESGVSGSTRAEDGIRFLPTASSAPTAGQAISITYAYNQLIRDLQADAADEEVAVEGRDLLYRLGTRVDIYLTAGLRVFSTFTPNKVKTLVETAIKDFINDLGLDDSVEESDIQQVVRKISGVDNFVITRLTDEATGTNAEDVELTGRQYPRIDSVNLLITFI